MSQVDDQQRPSLLEDTSLACLLAVATLRLLTSFDPFPYWSGDPLVRFTPLTGIGPAFAASLDVLTLFSAALALFAAARRGRAISWVHILLWSIGAAVVFVNIGFGSHVVLQQAILGLPWVAALAAAIGAHGLASDARHRRVILSVFAGLAIILLCKGIMQVYFEHPAMVEAFKRDRLSIFAENGWSPDSSTALAYERRLLQPEATGWIGLANPFATFAAIAATIGFAGVVIPSVHPVATAVRRPVPWPAIVLLLAGMISTGLAGAKGGVVSMAAGFALVLVAKWCPDRLRRFGPALGITLPLAVLSLVVVRGVIGERLGELSIYFRSMYAQAALKIFSQHPLAGVGPAGFKDAYLMAKNPLNPEEVSSPHSVFLDYISTLGVGGIAWIVLLLLLCAAAGRSLLASPQSVVPSDLSLSTSRADLRRVAAILTIPTLIAAWLESSIATPEELVVRLGGLVAASIIALAMLARASHQSLSIAAAAAALVAIIHGQIELTPVLPQTVLWFALLLAGATSIRSSAVSAAPSRMSLLRSMPVALAALVAIFVCIPVARWEAHLKASAAAVEPLSSIRQLLAAIPADSRALADAADIASHELGRSVARDPASIESAFGTIAARQIPLAAKLLADAAAASRGDPATLRSLSQFYVQTANADPAKFKLAEQAALDAAQSPSGLSRSTSWAWVGTVQRGLFDRDKDQSRLVAARDAYILATKFDPHSLQPVLKLVDLSQQLGDTAATKSWAANALQLDALMRLDPLKGLSVEQAAKMHQLSGIP